MWVAITKYHRLGGLKQFLTALEAGKSKIKTLADLVSDKDLFLVHRCATGARELSGASLIRALMLWMRAPPS